MGGLSPVEATAAVKAFFARPLVLRLGKVTLRVTPKQLGASAYVGDAIKHARDFCARRERAVEGRGAQGSAWSATRRRSRSGSIVSQSTPTLRLRDSKPVVTKEQQGRRIRQALVVRDLYRSLKTHARDPIVLKQDVIVPHDHSRLDR